MTNPTTAISIALHSTLAFPLGYDDGGDGGGDGGNGELPDGVTLEHPAIKKLIEASVAEATAGLKENRDTALAEKRALSEKVKTLEETWGGLDAERVKQIMQRIENDEETKLIAEGKIDEVLELRTEALKGNYEQRIEGLQKNLDEATAALTASKDRIKGLFVESHVRQAASEMNVVPTAIPDALARAMSVFALDDEEKSIVSKNPDGSVKLGKDAKNPLSAAEWLEGMRERAPHWFPGSSGAGAGGGQGQTGNAITISRSKAQNHAEYRAAKERAAKAGVELRIVDDEAA